MTNRNEKSISDNTLPIPQTDDDIFNILDPFILAFAESVSATAKIDGIVTLHEYKALAEISSKFDELTIHPGLMSTLILYFLVNDVPLEIALHKLNVSSENLTEDEKLTFYKAINPIVLLQGERQNEIKFKWENALNIKSNIMQYEYSNSLHRSLKQIINKISLLKLNKYSQIDKAIELGTIFNDKQLISYAKKLKSDKVNYSESDLDEKIKTSINQAIQIAEEQLKSDKTLDEQVEISERFIQIVETLIEHIKSRLQSVKNRLNFQNEMFNEDLNIFIKGAADSVELGMRDLMEGRQNWADKTIWDQFKSRGAYNEIVNNFNPIKRRYERIFEQWYLELESFSKEVGSMRAGVLKNIDPKVFSGLVPTDHKGVEIKNAIDKAADTTIGITVLGTLGTAGLVALGVLKSSAVVAIMANPVGAVIGGTAVIASVWKIFSDPKSRKRQFIQEKRYTIERELEKILKEEVLNHQEIAQDIMNRFLQSSFQQITPLIIDARMAALRAKIEKDVVHLILNDTKQSLNALSTA